MQRDGSAEMICKGVVRGTPRTYGNRRSEDIWRRTIVEGNWEGVDAISILQIPVHLDFAFRVNPKSPAYYRNVSSNGPDLDTMVIGALGGLLDSRNPERPTLRLLREGGLCRSLTATKSIVDSDDTTGFTLSIRPVDVICFQNLQDPGGFSFFVDWKSLKKDRRRAVQQAAEQANGSGIRAPKGTQVEIELAFSETLTRNPLSADWLEAVIDGLGASRVGSQRFFAGPPAQAFGYDDSVVYRLTWRPGPRFAPGSRTPCQLSKFDGRYRGAGFGERIALWNLKIGLPSTHRLLSLTSKADPSLRGG